MEGVSGHERNGYQDGDGWWRFSRGRVKPGDDQGHTIEDIRGKCRSASAQSPH